MNRRKPASSQGFSRKDARGLLRLLAGAGLTRLAGVSDTDWDVWAPKTAGERLAVWQLSWRRTGCRRPGCRCALDLRNRHGPYLTLWRAEAGKRYRVYVPTGVAGAVEMAVRRAKGVRKRRVRREHAERQYQRQAWRWARAVLRRARR